MEKTKYMPIEEDGRPNDGKNWQSWYTQSVKQLFCIHAILLVMSLTLFVLSLATYSRMTGPNALIKATSFYSPVFQKVDLPLSDQQVRDSRYLNTDPMAIYRQPPSPEVDHAWDRISDVQAILINSEEVKRLGKDPGQTVRAPKRWGYGPDAHWAEIDVFHQIHCLNSIRQSLYRDYYTGKDNETNPLAWGHITHCIHNLVQYLMCTASADVVTYNWVEGKAKPVPDFNINHKCRDFEGLLEWQNDHKLPDPRKKWDDISMPVGFSPLPPDTSGVLEEGE